MNIENIKKTRSERGFTIVELLIVIVVIGILAAIIIVAYNGVTNRAKASKAQSAAQTVIKKAEAYNAEQGSYPDTLSDMTGAASTTTYFLTGVTLATTAIAAAPTNEATINYATCATPAGVRVSYWDYGASPAAIAHLYTGGATGSSTCTLATS